ncbi:MAG: hypothetical protein WCX31_13895 [Salinivirgaceae bacterium]|jgi:hypothetical protein
MKQLVKNTGSKKQYFGQFAKLTVNDMKNALRRGIVQTPSKEELPRKL